MGYASVYGLISPESSAGETAGGAPRLTMEYEGAAREGEGQSLTNTAMEVAELEKQLVALRSELADAKAEVRVLGEGRPNKIKCFSDQTTDFPLGCQARNAEAERDAAEERAERGVKAAGRTADMTIAVLQVTDVPTTYVVPSRAIFGTLVSPVWSKGESQVPTAPVPDHPQKSS